MQKNVKAFIKYAVGELIESGCQIVLEKKEDVKNPFDGMEYSGFFERRPYLCFHCAIGLSQKDWFPVFVHEFAHFLQYKDESKKTPYWIQQRYAEKILPEPPGNDPIYLWLEKKLELNPKVIKKLARVTQRMELDADKRAIGIIKRFDLPIDIDWYIKTTNAYILFFNIITETRMWFDKEPGVVPEIYKIMPNTWKKGYSKTPKKYRELVMKHCFK